MFSSDTVEETVVRGDEDSLEAEEVREAQAMEDLSRRYPLADTEDLLLLAIVEDMEQVSKTENSSLLIYTDLTLYERILYCDGGAMLKI